MSLLRKAQSLLGNYAQYFRVLAVVGPRQSGKTTLARMTFPDKPYVSLEDPDVLEFAKDDPRGFLGQFPQGAILDEIQRAPHLFSYLQGIVDLNPVPGLFVLTGSHQFDLLGKMTQSLAGRAILLELLPFSLQEIKGNLPIVSLAEQVVGGGYPAIRSGGIPRALWHKAYVASYVERDLRQILNIKDLNAFRRFLSLCAGNIGQIFNASRLGADVGVDHKTISSWLSALEASFILFTLPPHHENFRKRMIKSPKIYFYDTGLASYLLGIESEQQWENHAMRGPLFENWCITEILKDRLNQGKARGMYFWRDSNGLEIDLITEEGDLLCPWEMKSGQTVASDWFKGLQKWTALAGSRSGTPRLIYGGTENYERSGVRVMNWRDL